jgi:hypothetical protein
MTSESETIAALKRASQRAMFHLLRAGVEGLKAIEAFVDELAQLNRKAEEQDGDRVTRIEVE